MKVLFDTNVVLDLLLDRPPFAEASEQILLHAEKSEIQGYLCATTVTTIYYIAAKTIGGRQALLAIRKLLSLFEIAPVNRPVLEQASQSDFSDFEDAVLYEAAREVGAEAIVSRNQSDFQLARIPVYLPEEMLRVLGERLPEHG